MRIGRTAGLERSSRRFHPRQGVAVWAALLALLAAGMAVTPIAAQQEEWPIVRYVEDFGAVGDGVTDDSRAIQEAMNAGYDGVWSYAVVVRFSPGKTYRLAHQLVLWSGIRLETQGAPPATLLLAANTPGFQDPNRVRYMVFSRLCSARPDCPENPDPFPADPNAYYRGQGHPFPGWPWRWPEDYDSAIDDEALVHPGYGPGNRFWTQIRNLNFKVEAGNPGAAGVYLLSAQGSHLQDVTIEMESGHHAVVTCNSVNLNIIGGRYGLYDPPKVELGNLINSRFRGQQEAAYYGRGAARTFIGCSFEDVPVAVRGHHKSLVMVGCRLRNVNTGIVATQAGRPTFLQDLEAVNTPYLYRSPTRAIPGDPSGEVTLPTYTQGEVFDNGEWASNGGIFPTTTELPTWSSVPTDFDLENAADVKDFGAVGDGQADDTEALRRAIAAADTVYLSPGAYRVTDSLMLGENTRLVGLGVHRSRLLLAAHTPGFEDPDNPRPILDTPDSPTASVHLRDLGFDVDTFRNPGSLAIRWRCGRHSSISWCQLCPAVTSLLVTGHGGGTFLNNWTATGRPEILRGIVVDHNLEPAVFYGMSSEHQHDKSFHLIGARDVVLYNAGSEGDYPAHYEMTRIENSDRIAFIDPVFNPAPNPEIITLIRVINTPNLWLGPLNRIHNQTVKHTVLDERPDGTVVDLASRGYLLYRWGEINQEGTLDAEAWQPRSPQAWLVARAAGEQHLQRMAAAQIRPSGHGSGVPFSVVETQDGVLRVPASAQPVAAHLYIFCPKTDLSRMTLHTTCPASAWLNGEQLLSAAPAGLHRMRPRLRSGWNRLLLSLQPGQDAASVRLEVRRGDGKLFTGLRFDAEPPPVSDVWNLQTAVDGRQVSLSWRPSSEYGFAKVRVVRNHERYPQGPQDGEVIYEGRAQTCRDVVQAEVSSVYYGVYAEDLSGARSRGALRRVDLGGAGYLQDWLACGTFSLTKEQGTGYDVDFIGETEVEPTVGQVSGGRPWIAVKPEARRDGMVDLLLTFPPEEGPLHFQVGYVHTYVYAPQEVDCHLLLGADDGYTVWLNGQFVAGADRAGMATPDEFRHPVRLQAGWNRLLIKVTQGRGDWKIIARLAREDGSAVVPALHSALSPDMAEAQTRGADLDRGLAHHWSFDTHDPTGKVADRAGGATGQLTGGARLVNNPVLDPEMDPWALGVPRGVPQAGVEIPVEAFAGSRGEFTLAAWVFLEAGSPGAVVLANYPGGTFQPGIFQLNLDADRNRRVVRFEAADERGQGFQHLPTCDLRHEQWTHVVATLTPQEARVYLDGDLVASRELDYSAESRWLASPRYPLRLGGLNVASGEESEAESLPACYLDNVRVYTRALLPAEVVALYLSGR